MKKDYMYIGLLILCIIIVIWGIIGLISINYNVKEESQSNNIGDIYENEHIITTATNEEKISPNAKFALKKYYDECSHFDYNEAELPVELVNLTRQEVEDYYDDWEVETFSDTELVLVKEINGYCDQHFLLRLDDDNINVYRLNNLGEPVLYKTTDIVKEYLTEDDIKTLKEGIYVYSEGKLSSALEDFE